MTESVFNDLAQLRVAFLETANQHTISYDDIQRLILRTEDFHHNIFILQENGIVSSDCACVLRDTLTALQQCEIYLETSHNKEPVGRPKIIISRGQLEFLVSMGFNKTQLSRMLGVSTRTISRRMTGYNLEGVQFSDLTDEDLDRIVIDVHRQFPQSGYRQVLAILRSQGIVVREHQLRKSLQRCDPLGSTLRWFVTIQRRKYNVCCPLALWHLDGNHKLIRYSSFFICKRKFFLYINTSWPVVPQAF